MGTGHWQVQLLGLSSDLEHLARFFSSPPARVIRDDQDAGFLYESETFTPCSTSEEVRAVAEHEVFVLSGALKLDRSSSEPLRVGAVYRPNARGGRDVSVLIRDSVAIRSEIGELEVEVTDAHGRKIPQPQREVRTVAIIRLSRSDEAVAKALRLLAAADALSWTGLYRIYEVVEEDVGGEHALERRSWSSASDLKRFKRSANSVAAAGDAARHGAERHAPPKRPMALAAAGAYVRRVLNAWLASKGG